MRTTVEIELDAQLLRLIESRAARLGKDRSEVISEALRRGLEGGRLRQILDARPQDFTLSEDEAMKLAIEELRVVRADRVATPGD